MKLYMMNKRPIVPKHKTLCHCMPQTTGGYVPLMLDVHHGAGAAIPVPRPVDISRAKTLLGGLTIAEGKKKKYVSI